jgi:hypothetical protein
MNPSLVGAIRGLGVALITVAVAYFADPSHLTFLSTGEGAVVAAFMLAIEHAIEAWSGKALMGSVKVKRI